MSPSRTKAVAEAPPPAGAASGQDPYRPPARITTGNPRITVAFPFSSISIDADTTDLAEVADLVSRLAAAVADLAEDLAWDPTATPGDARLDRIAALRELAVDSEELADRLAER